MADKVNRFVALTSCIYTNVPFTGQYEIDVTRYLKYDELGIYNYYGGDESSATPEQVCSNFTEYDCKEVASTGEYA